MHRYLILILAITLAKYPQYAMAQSANNPLQGEVGIESHGQSSKDVLGVNRLPALTAKVEATSGAATKIEGCQAVVVSPDGKTIYMGNTSFNNLHYPYGCVSVIDSNSMKQLNVIPIDGSATEGGLALSADGATLYCAANKPSGSVSVIDTRQQQVRTTIPLEILADGRLVLSSDGKRLFVGTLSGKINIIDTATDAVIDTLEVSSYESNIAMALAPDENRLYVGGMNMNNIQVIDLASRRKLQDIPVQGGGGNVMKMIISSNKQQLISQGIDDVIQITNLSNGKIAKIFPEDKIAQLGAGSMAINPDATRLFIPSSFPPLLFVIDLVNGKRMPDVAIDPYSKANSISTGVALSPDGSIAYAVDYSGYLVRIKTANNTVIGVSSFGLPLSSEFSAARLSR